MLLPILVTFGYFFYRWRARLCGWRGSSSTQGIGGRVRTPAPTAGRLQICRRVGPRPARRVKRKFLRWREGHTPGWLLLPLRGNSPSAPPLQHYSTTRNGLVVFVGEPLGLPPHPSGLTASHLPLKGKALKTRSSAFPFRGRCPRRGRMRYPCFELGMLARQTQAREWNRASSNFRKPRAQWPGGNLECHSDFARWKYSAHSKG